MTTSPDEPDQQIADDVLPAQVDELAVPVDLDQLFPWHRPRKQLVREEQWLYFSRRLVESENDRPGWPSPSLTRVFESGYYSGG